MAISHNNKSLSDVYAFNNSTNIIDGYVYTSTTTDGVWTVYTLSDGNKIAKYRGNQTCSACSQTQGVYRFEGSSIDYPSAIPLSSIVSCDIIGCTKGTSSVYGILQAYTTSGGKLYFCAYRFASSTATIQIRFEVTLRNF